MLGSRTKQVFAYGKRGQRIVNVTATGDSEDTTSVQTTGSDQPKFPTNRAPWKDHALLRPASRPVNEESSSDFSATSSDESVPAQKSKTTVRTTKLKPSNDVPPATRKPLSNVSANVAPNKTAGRPSLKGKETKRKASAIGTRTPKARGQPISGRIRSQTVDLTPVARRTFVELDITVLDQHGKKVGQERRVSRPLFQEVKAVKAVRKGLGDTHRSEGNDKGKRTVKDTVPISRNIIVLSDSDSDDETPRPPPKPKSSGRSQHDTIIISSDDEPKSKKSAPRRVAQPRSKTSIPAQQSNDDENEDDDDPLSSINKTTTRVRTLRGRTIISSSDESDAGSRASPVQAPKDKHRPAPSLPHHVDPPPRRKSVPAPVAVPRKAAVPSVRPAYQPHPSSSSAPFSPRVRKVNVMPTRAKYVSNRAPVPASPFPVHIAQSSSESELDSEFDYAAELSRLDLDVGDAVREAPQPKYLLPLLTECSQTTPYEFSAFVKMFPSDPIAWSVDPSLLDEQRRSSHAPRFEKIGEASFSEVFGIGGVVLKIIPLRDESSSGSKHEDLGMADGPAPSDAKDVLKEIVVTRAMGELCNGFVGLLRTYVVRGKYPTVLLDLWDEYDERKGSEGTRPDTFSVSQTYAIIVLPNGGPDLETYVFPTGSRSAKKSPVATPWRQACSIFWQVTRTMAIAEDLVNFEHRDLHWGQILVKPANQGGDDEKRRHGGTTMGKVSMDDAVYGVRTTVIDLGLARMDSGEGSGKDARYGVHWTPFDDETFEGQGDYQFDIYRMMRAHIGDHAGQAWKAYRPLTNVMWLHYLAVKLLTAKRLRAPVKPTASAASRAAPPIFTERESYECLVEIEGVLRDAVAHCQVEKKARRKTQAGTKVKTVEGNGPANAEDVLDIGIMRGWVLPTDELADD